MKIYVASSWRNAQQPDVVSALREAGHEVYDFRNPAPGNTGFHWSEIDPQWQNWNGEQFADALRHPVAESGFNFDKNALDWCEACVLVLPSGRSAHLEAGYIIGQDKPTAILLTDQQEPELMYKLATTCLLSVEAVVAWANTAKDLPPFWSDVAASAYRAYAASTGNKNFRGEPMPTWEQLPRPIQIAWEAAARHVWHCGNAGEILDEQRWTGWLPPADRQQQKEG